MSLYRKRHAEKEFFGDGHSYVSKNKNVAGAQRAPAYDD